MASTKHLSLWKIWNLVLFKPKSYPHIYSSWETYEDMHQRLSIHITNYKLQSFSPYIDLSGSQHHFSLPWLSNHCMYASKTYIQCGLEEISCQTLTKEWWSWRKIKQIKSTDKEILILTLRNHLCIVIPSSCGFLGNHMQSQLLLVFMRFLSRRWTTIVLLQITTNMRLLNTQTKSVKRNG